MGHQDRVEESQEDIQPETKRNCSHEKEKKRNIQGQGGVDSLRFIRNFIFYHSETGKITADLTL